MIAIATKNYYFSNCKSSSAARLAVILCVTSFCMLACHPRQEHGVAEFSYFHYSGNDSTYACPIDETCQFQNPVISGFYPDPSICRKGNDYYLVVSSFAYYPGIPIFHSVDLVNWKQIGHVLNRPSQLPLDNIRISGGVYAPTIRYNQHNNTFYIINTAVGGIGNFLVKTANPLEENWSEPIPLKFNGIDPDLFFDDDGKGYIVHNDEPPGTPEWGGHRAIWLRQLDVAGDSICGEKICIVDGGTDKSKHPVWIEAPHLYKINGYYYLMCAEGGTSTEHSEVIFRADKVTGPYIPWKNNPILTQRDLPDDRPNPITCAGHADLIQTPESDWYAVFLACRPYEGGHYNTGRETFLLPVEWKDEYPVILPPGETIPYVVEKHPLTPTAGVYKGNFSYRDNFKENKLNDRWIFIRNPRTDWWSLSSAGLRIKSSGHTIYEQANPAFIGSRQQHIHFEVQTELNYHPKSQKDVAGLVCFQNEKYNFVFGKTIGSNGTACIALDEAKNGEITRLSEIEVPKGKINVPFTLKVTGNGALYSFYVSFNGGDSWTPVVENADGTILSTQTAGGFTGVVIGMYVTTDEPANLRNKTIEYV